MATTNREFNAKNGALIGTNSANYLQLLGATTGNSVSINAVGADENINISLVPKGTGTINFSSTGITLSSGTAGGVVYLDSNKKLIATAGFTVNGTNVGIGNTTPGAKLDVAGNIRLSSANASIELNAGGPQLYAPVANTLSFASGGGVGSPTERMRIDSSGNVGIGTITPGAKLEVNGSVKFPTVGTSGIIGLGTDGELSSVTIGSGLNLSGGTLTASASVSVSDDTATNATYYPVFSTSTSGAPTLKVSSTKLQFVPSTGTLYATIFQSLSDKELKTNIETIVEPYAVLELEGVKYDLVDGSGTQYGFIAQDVEKIIPELVGFNGRYKSVNYNGIIPFLVETVKKQQSVINSFISRIEKLENK
jgi:hypothetical protein